MFSRLAEKKIINVFQARSKHIDISNHYPEDVLAAYYNEAKPHNLFSALRYNPEKKMSPGEARSILDKHGAKITSLKGMAINMTIASTAIDDTDYNKIHGDNSSEAALAALNSLPEKEKPSSRTDARAQGLAYGWSKDIRNLLPNPYLGRNAYALFDQNIQDNDSSVLIPIRNMLLKIGTPATTELIKQIRDFIYDGDGSGDIWTATREETIALFLNILKIIPGSITEYSDRYVAASRLETVAMKFGIPGLFKDALEDMTVFEENEHAAVQEVIPPQQPASIKENSNHPESERVRSKIEEFKGLSAYATAYMLGRQDAEYARKSRKNGQSYKKSSTSWNGMWTAIGGTAATALVYALIQNIVDDKMAKLKNKTQDDANIEEAHQAGFFRTHSGDIKSGELEAGMPNQYNR